MLKLAILSVVAFLFLGGGDEGKLRLKLHKNKRHVEVEIFHTPQERNRWIYVSGNSETFTSGSLIQSDGLDCAIIHRIVWRDVPQVGILEVRIDVRDSENKIIESTEERLLFSVIEGGK